MFVFKKVVFNKEKGVEKIPELAEDNRYTKLIKRIDELEANLQESLALLDASSLAVNSPFSSPRSDHSALDYYQIAGYKEYLKEIYYQLKKRKIKGVSTFDIHENEKRLEKYNRSIEKIGRWIIDFISLDGKNIFGARNRAGRGGERIGSESNSTAYGTFLEIGIHGQGCLLFASGILFDEQEITTHLKYKNADFISYTLLTHFAIHANAFGIFPYNDIFKKCYNEASQLLYQSLNDVSYNSLKALVLMGFAVNIKSDKFLIDKIRSSMLRMGYALGLDKPINRDELSYKTPEELKIIIWKRKMWNFIIMDFFDQNSKASFDEFFTNNYDPEEFILINHLENRYFQSNRSLTQTKMISSNVRLHCLEINTAMRSHKSKLSNSQLKLLTFEQMKLPVPIYLRVQSILNNYCAWFRGFLDIEMRRYSSKEQINIEVYFCNFPSGFCEQHRSVYFFKNSITFYILQIEVIYPLIITNPNPIEIPALELNIMLSSALKLDSLISMLLYSHLKQISDKFQQNNEMNELVLLIEKYLTNYKSPITGETLIQYARSLLGMINFDKFLYPIYAYLIILSSKSLHNELTIPEIAFVKKRLSNMLEGLNIASRLNPNDKFNLDFTLAKFSSAQKKFSIFDSFGKLED